MMIKGTFTLGIGIPADPRRLLRDSGDLHGCVHPAARRADAVKHGAHGLNLRNESDGRDRGRQGMATLLCCLRG